MGQILDSVPACSTQASGLCLIIFKVGGVIVGALVMPAKNSVGVSEATSRMNNNEPPYKVMGKTSKEHICTVLCPWGTGDAQNQPEGLGQEPLSDLDPALRSVYRRTSPHCQSLSLLLSRIYLPHSTPFPLYVWLDRNWTVSHSLTYVVLCFSSAELISPFLGPHIYFKQLQIKIWSKTPGGSAE